MVDLNDYDGNILQESSYKEVQDDVFKLEYKISKIETELKEINIQIQSANEIYDYYEDRGISAKTGNYRPDFERLLDDIKMKNWKSFSEFCISLSSP